MKILKKLAKAWLEGMQKCAELQAAQYMSRHYKTL